MIEITDGLTDDDDVITVGQVGLKADATVSVINRPAEDGPVDDVPVEETGSGEAVADGSD